MVSNCGEDTDMSGKRNALLHNADLKGLIKRHFDVPIFIGHCARKKTFLDE
jgi:hypothetical protein